MKKEAVKTAGLAVLGICLVLAGGCGLRAVPIVGAAVGGGLIGGIIGYQSGEALAGALIGGGISGGWDAAKQADEIGRNKESKAEKKEITVNIKQEDGSYKPIRLKKSEENIYTDPDGNQYMRQKDGALVPVTIKK